MINAEMVFNIEAEIDSDGHSLVLMKVIYKGNDITDKLSDNVSFVLEDLLNDQ